MRHVGIVVLALAALTGCSTQPPAPTADDPAATATAGQGDRHEGGGTEDPSVRAVATVAPLADLVSQVAGERGAIASLVPSGADSHTYEPSPSDLAELEQADAYFGNGLGLNDGALDLAGSAIGGDAPVVRLGEALDEDDLVGDHDHDHDHEHDHGAGPNPHTWMSVPLAMTKVERIADVLAEVDPAGADTYQANADDYLAELAALHESIAEAAATVPADQRTIVTFHDAYRYFAGDYGFEVVGAVQPSDFSEPAPGDVAALIDQIDAEGVPAIFGSQVFPDGVSEQIAAETGADYYTGLYDDMLPGEPGDARHSYTGLMAQNARVIIDGLGGNPELVAGP